MAAQQLRGWLLVALAMAGGCVDAVDPVLPPGRIDLQPGVGVSVVFDDRDGALQGVALSVAPDAVTRTQTIQLFVPASTAPVFFAAGMQLRTPVVAIEPFDGVFARPVELSLPWYPFAETVAGTDVRAFAGVGLDGIPNGLWRTAEVRSELPERVVVSLQRGGIYWAGTLEVDPARTPVDTVGDPCFADSVGLDVCTEASACRPSGCLGEFCGAATAVASTCRPSAMSQERFGCACRCGGGLCQWVR